ncbi:Actinidain protein [Dioscorea alata]|uniref:Actinidain protein n=1 Tax=Dioscorea alata TaxID=55571 RepID=A0ACB7VF69_DIOAL|nr:Actinidain protein [Dioscorea alata]
MASHIHVVLLFNSIFSLFLLYSSSSPVPVRSEYEVSLLFEGWLVKLNKSYQDLAEKEKRYDIFKDNLKYIDEHNAGNHTFTLALNVFADITDEEYRATYLGTLPTPSGIDMIDDNGNESDKYNFNETVDAVPDSIDWRDLGAVQPVRNQGGCFSCWAFTAVAAIEGINQIVTGDVVALSEQQLVDCERKSCDPYYLDKPMQYVMKNGGIDTRQDYPYTAVYAKCDTTKESNKVVTIDGYKWIPSNNEKILKTHVARQPIAGALEGYERAFKLYGSGVFTKYCGTALDHAVTLIGYGTEGTQDYWLIKNSWGDFWGEAGYLRLERNVNDPAGKCGIAKMALYPTKNKPLRVKEQVQSPLDLSS